MNFENSALALVIDRSGSMQCIANDVVGSVKQFIGNQKQNPGKASLTVVQFDHCYEVIHDFEDLQTIDGDKFTKGYNPRGSTALLDAIGRTTLAMKQKLDSMPPADQPKRVVIAVITDGLENASREFSLEKVKELIKQHEALGWSFMFLGATLDAVQVAESMGFSNSKSAVYDVQNFNKSMQAIGEQMTLARKGASIEFSKEQRDSLVVSAQI